MKTLFTLIAFLFFVSSNCFSQKVSYLLDKANGFKQFHFHDKKSKWGDSLKQSYGSYEYTGYCCPTGFGMPLSNISLTFDSLNNLVSLSLGTQSGLTKGAVKYMIQYMKEAYGEPEIAQLWDDGEEFPALKWEGRKVGLTVMFVESSVNPGTYGVMMMYGLKNPNPVYTKDY